jgi:large subunit ribosomal protein L24
MSTPKVHVKKGDTVMVITGKDKGKKGKVTQVVPKDSKVFVEGVNVVKRHTKPTQTNPQGGIVKKEAPIHSSNVKLVCSKCGPVRVNKMIEGEDKFRVCNKCGNKLD